MHAERCYEQGASALAAGRFQQAEQALWDCIALMPAHGAALHLLGKIRRQQGQLQQALALQQRSLAVAPQLGWNAFAAGELLEQQQRWSEAHQAFCQAAAVLPQEAWIDGRRRQAEGLAALGGACLADGLSPAAYSLWCRQLEPPLPIDEPQPGLLDRWWVDLGPGARLRPGALTWLAQWLQHRQPAGGRAPADLLYADEDRIDAAGIRNRPWLKPQWQSESFWATPWLDGLALWRWDWLREHGLTPPASDCSALERWQWQLQALQHRPQALHVPRILVHQQQLQPGQLSLPPQAPKPDDLPVRQAEALGQHLVQLGEAGVTVLPQGEGFALLWAISRFTRVSLIVCTRDRPDLLGACLSSLEATLRQQPSSSRIQWEWLVVDNGSRLQATAELLASWSQRPGTRLRSIPMDAPFNWSGLNNQAAAEASGELLLFINNDVRATAHTQPGWLAAMAGMARREPIGAVGACLLDPQGRLQHAGLVPALAPGCEHPYRGLDPAHDVHRGRSRYLTVWPAVTGACLMVKRSLFHAAGGFCPGFPIEGNDVDFCLRLASHGLRQVVVPEAVLEHQEGSTRGGSAGASASWRAAMEGLRRRWPQAFCAPDPCWPSACSLESPDGRPVEFAGKGWL